MEKAPIRRKVTVILAGLAVLVIAGVVLAKQRSSDSTASQRQLARLITVHELTKHHATKLETDECFQAAMDGLWDQLRVQGEVGLEWEWKFVSTAKASSQVPTKPDRNEPLTGFEKQAVQHLSGDGNELFEPIDDGGFRYARVIRAERSCVTACHRPAPNGMPGTLAIPGFEPGQTMGTLFVEAHPRKH